MKNIVICFWKETIVFLLILSTFFWTPLLSAQEVSGKILLGSTAAKNVRIQNITRKFNTYSKETGRFRIKANLQDTLIFGSAFYESKQFIVDSTALERPVKIHIKKKRFNLTEVILNAKGRDTLDVKKYNTSFQQKLSQDKQKHPYLYRPNHGNIGNLYLFVRNLISGKPKKNPKVIPDITADNLKNLFTEDSLFNDDLLQNTFKISPKESYLFFVYCEDQHLDGTLLKENHRFQLLDHLVDLAKKFKN